MTQEVADTLAATGHQIPITLVLYAIDPVRFTPVADRRPLRARLGLGRFSHLVSILGLVSERKGHRFFLEMASRLRAEWPDAGFLVVGEDVLQNGAYRRAMEAYARTLGIADRVIFYRFAADDLARDIVAASDLLVLPTSEEGFGLSLAEAQACEVPVVSTRLSAVREVVDDGETGLLVKPGDVEELTSAVRTLLADEQRRVRMGKQGRKRVTSLFAPARYAREVDAVYEVAMAGSRGRQAAASPHAHVG
jgi:glycosyltransferase involved in cell wall biosynthesis